MEEPLSDAKHWDNIRGEIDRLCESCGRDPGEVRIIAVTKGFGPNLIEQASEAGFLDLGESYVQEALSKKQTLRPNVAERINWHMIGHLQSNKVRKIVGKFELIHSIDRTSVVEEFAKRQPEDHPQRVLVQLNVTGEESKFGVVPEEAEELVSTVLDVPGLELDGFMTMAPWTEDEAVLREAFAECRRTRDDLSERFNRSFPELSMGMTNDYPQAIREGATFIRLGRKLFGERPEGD